MLSAPRDKPPQPACSITFELQLWMFFCPSASTLACSVHDPHNRRDISAQRKHTPRLQGFIHDSVCGEGGGCSIREYSRRSASLLEFMGFQAQRAGVNTSFQRYRPVCLHQIGPSTIGGSSPGGQLL